MLVQEIDNRWRLLDVDTIPNDSTLLGKIKYNK